MLAAPAIKCVLGNLGTGNLKELCVDVVFFFFFFNDTATTEIYTLSLHDALPIFICMVPFRQVPVILKRILLAPSSTIKTAFLLALSSLKFLCSERVELLSDM